jgi:putative Ca2+/H+ antiporter (TMEM165/GDT1 family)
MDDEVKERDAYSVFALTAVTFFLAAMGDELRSSPSRLQPNTTTRLPW